MGKRKTPEEQNVNIAARSERIKHMTNLERKTESRRQARQMAKIRNYLCSMANEFEGDFILLSSFPNFVLRTNQICTAGRGKEFLKHTDVGRLLKYRWKKFNMEAQISRGMIVLYPVNLYLI